MSEADFSPASRHSVVVVGAGPGGVAAALEASRWGRSVLLIDERTGFGGQIWRNAQLRNYQLAGPAKAQKLLTKLEASNVECRWQTSVLSACPSSRALLIETAGQASWVEFQQLILATGAREFFLPFPGWTLPNVVGVGGLQAMIKSGARVAGQKVVITGSGPLLLPVAALAKRAGAEVIAVAEQAPRSAVALFASHLWRHPGKLREAAGYRTAFLATRYQLGTWVESAQIESAQIESGQQNDSALQVKLTDGHRQQTIQCNLLATSYGLVPASELGLVLDCQANEFGELQVDATQQTSVAGVYAVGECSGVGGADLALVEGRIAGATVAGGTLSRSWLRQRSNLHRFARNMASAFEPRQELHQRVQDDTLVCRCEDVTWHEIDPSVGPRENKLQSRCGMGLCQGRVCMPALSSLCGWQQPAVPRPPIQPTQIANLMNPIEPDLTAAPQSTSPST